MSGWYDTSVGRTIRWDPCLTHEGRREEILRIARLYPDVRNFVETGTNDGGTTVAVSPHFDNVYTIEVGEHIFKRNLPLFKKYRNVEPLLGDSAVVLPDLLQRLNGPALFWLDGHYCGDARADKDTPVKEEIELILGTSVPHVILVDDARLFGNDPEYPTVDWVRNFSTTRDIRYDFSYADDIIRILPR